MTSGAPVQASTDSTSADHTDVVRSRRVALVGHACSPYFGSEPGITWRWASYLAMQHEVVCFCHPERRADIDKEMALRPIPNLRFVYVELDPRHDPWIPGTENRGLRIHYSRWQHKVLDAIRHEHRTAPFDLVHHVSWGSLNQPPQLWRLDLPYVWGPIGGGQLWPASFLRYTGGLKQRLIEMARGTAVKLARFNPAVRQAARTASLILATNRETALSVRRAGARWVELMLDSEFEGGRVPDRMARENGDGVIKIIWAGRLEPRKGLMLALSAMAKLDRSDIQLLIAGDGPQRGEIQSTIDRLGLAGKVVLLGRVPYEQMTEKFAQSDAFLFTSLRDSMGTVVREAMSAGLPVICLDHQGVAVAVTAQTGIKIPVHTPQQVIDDLAAGLRRLADDAGLRQRLSENVRAAAEGNAWPHRIKTISQMYEKILRQHNKTD
ncbi:MAG: glycosyltransferase family 4 protein [Phycisphaerales bacterium]|nr:glycosyltransferase family 4 protein [Phycisphaerales bacterium]